MLIESITLEFILERVCDVAEINIEAIKNRSRKRELIEAKQAYFLLAMKLTNEGKKGIYKNSLATIGQVVFRNHSTVLYAKKNESIPEIQQIIKNTKLL